MTRDGGPARPPGGEVAESSGEQPPRRLRPEDLVVCLIPLWEQLGLASAWCDTQRWLRHPPGDGAEARRALRRAETRVSSFCDGLYRPLAALKDLGLSVPRSLLQRLELAAHGDWEELGLGEDGRWLVDDVVELQIGLLTEIRRLERRVRNAAAAFNPPPPRQEVRVSGEPRSRIEGTLLWLDIYDNTAHGIRVGDERAWARLRSELFETIWDRRPDQEQSATAYAFPDSGDLEAWFVPGGDSASVRRALRLAEHALLATLAFSRSRAHELALPDEPRSRLHLKVLMGTGRFSVAAGPDGNRVSGKLVNQLGQLEKQPFCLRPSTIVMTSQTLRRLKLRNLGPRLVRPYLRARVSGRTFDLHLLEVAGGLLEPRSDRVVPRDPIDVIARGPGGQTTFMVYNESRTHVALCRGEPPLRAFVIGDRVTLDAGERQQVSGEVCWVAKNGRLLGLQKAPGSPPLLANG